MSDSFLPQRSLRFDGGYWGAVKAALDGWWREIFMLTGFNLMWTISLFTLFALPPATAALFFVTRRVLEGDPFIHLSTVVEPIRRYWRAAWAWAIVVFAIAGVASANLWMYQDAPGVFWTVMRWFWATVLVVWGALNLFFWPLWFAQDEAHRTLRGTWRNCVAFLAANPLPVLLTTLLVLVLGAASVLTGVLLGVIFMVWVALLANAVLAAYLPREGV